MINGISNVVLVVLFLQLCNPFNPFRTFFFANALVPCTVSSECELRLPVGGSECIDGFCSNPFANGGCLKKMKSRWLKSRVCNSEDTPEMAEKGYCHHPQKIHFDYKEIRISSENWLSASIETWILQILLSEILDVPVTVETSVEDANSNFYDVKTRFQFGLPSDYSALETAKLVDGDCTSIKKEDGKYQPCSHFIPENWLGLNPELGMQELHGYDPSTDVLEPPIQLGALAREGWHIPKFTAYRDPSLMSFVGLQGEENRRKLAERFLRPTSWKDYCEVVSSNNCTIPDSIAFRYPVDATESSSYFVQGLYPGHFRKTDENDCDRNNSTCTGHIADFPCGWSSNVRINTFWNNIALKSTPYEYSHLVQIMMAANATKSDLMIQWWYPDLDYQRYLGSDSELLRISLPTITQKCLDHLVSPGDHCSLDDEIRNGDSRGACDEAPLPLQKIIGSVVRNLAKNPLISESLHSPAYDVLREFTITSYEIGEVFDQFLKVGIDPDNYDLRHATCQWFIDNYDKMILYIPEGYPRRLKPTETVTAQPIYYAAIVLASFALVASSSTSIFTWLQRKKQTIRIAQIEFLSVLLLGLIMVSIGSLLLALPATNAVCVAIIWTVNVGFTFEICPVVVKMTAIFRMMRAAERMEHLDLTRKSLFTAMLAPTLVAAAFLILWSILDPPKQHFEYDIIAGGDGGTGDVVEATPYCSSEWNSWYWVAVGWHFLLLVTATVQAFLARAVMRKIQDENQTLLFMIYSHFLFVCFRVATYWFHESFTYSGLSFARSLLFSADTIFTICIYFVPKLLGRGNGLQPTQSERECKRLAQISNMSPYHSGNDRSRALDGATESEIETSLRENTDVNRRSNRRPSTGLDQPMEPQDAARQQEWIEAKQRGRPVRATASRVNVSGTEQTEQRNWRAQEWIEAKQRARPARATIRSDEGEAETEEHQDLIDAKRRARPTACITAECSAAVEGIQHAEPVEQHELRPSWSSDDDSDEHPGYR